MFKERYDRIIRTIQAYGIDSPNDADQAADFINKLDPVRYSQFKVHLANNVAINGLEYPQDLVAAYNAASRYKIIIPTRPAGGKNTNHGVVSVVRTIISVLITTTKTTTRSIIKMRVTIIIKLVVVPVVVVLTILRSVKENVTSASYSVIGLRNVLLDGKYLLPNDGVLINSDQQQSIFLVLTLL
jgi:hypothetical protein